MDFITINKFIQIQKEVDYLSQAARNAIRYPAHELAKLLIECERAQVVVSEIYDLIQNADVEPESANSIARTEVSAFRSTLDDDLKLAIQRINNRINQIEWKRGITQ